MKTTVLMGGPRSASDLIAEPQLLKQLGAHICQGCDAAIVAGDTYCARCAEFLAYHESTPKMYLTHEYRGGIRVRLDIAAIWVGVVIGSVLIECSGLWLIRALVNHAR